MKKSEAVKEIRKLYKKLVDSDGVSVFKTATVTITSDNSVVEQPSISITSPADGDTVSGTISITTDATSDKFYNVYYFVDSAYKGFKTSEPFEFTLDTTTLSNGTHKILIRGYAKGTYEFVFNNIDVNVSN